ncbi:MAG: SUMF1/EgtB/PvdO family nonheme iron enzyme [Rhodoferax sp.]|nr:SUMF1/EgtB/PvdO family nonheme iron enzyme [Rhodoferax sp.]
MHSQRLLCFCLALLLSLAAQAQRVLGLVQLNVPGSASQNLYEKSYALVIGASNYRNGWSRLPGVLDDVKAVEAVLGKQGFTVTRVIDPTREQLDAALRSFVGKYGQKVNDRLLVYFAGHGHTLTTAAGGKLGYIVPVDAPNPNLDLGGFKATAYSMNTIEDLAKQMDSRHALFLFDSCFSGTIFRTRSGVPDSISDKTSKPVRQFITAGDEEQPVPDQSIFRRQLVEGLGEDAEADLNRDGYITGSELGMFLEDKVTNYSRRTQTPRHGKIQNPDLDKGDFVFVSLKGRAGTQVASIVPEPVTPLQPVRPVAPVAPATNPPSEDFGIRMVRIPAGSFEMGSNDGDSDEKPVHRVSVRAFELGATEVTQGQWRAVMGSNPSNFKDCGNDCPVEMVSWDDVQEFIKKLNQKTGKQYRLPSEAEWEYACRAGGRHQYCGSDDLDAVAWYSNNSGNKTQPVGKKQANAWGLYDMTGNVWEWVQDCWNESYSGAPTDGSAWMSGNCGLRAVRGGSWSNLPRNARAANRYWDVTANRDNSFGLRLARMLP